MDKGLKWLGVCILLSAIVVSAASVYKAKINIDSKEKAKSITWEDRYIFNMPDIKAFSVVDKETGTVYYYDGSRFREFNPVTKHYKETIIK